MSRRVLTSAAVAAVGALATLAFALGVAGSSAPPAHDSSRSAASPADARAATAGQPSARGPTEAERMPKGPFHLRTSHYEVRTTSASDIERSRQGRLVRLAREGGGPSFLIAYDPAIDVTSLPVRHGWRVEEVGRDAMWIPEACAQKPSWLVSGRYLVINDAYYDRNRVIDRYVVYDLSRRTFSYLTDPDATRGVAPTKVLHVAVEGDTLVFYLDFHDSSGPHRDSTEYRHSRAHDNGFVVRRVISPRDFSFADYKIPFSSPTVDNYTVQIHGASNTLYLGVNDESRTPIGIAKLVPQRKLALEPGWYVEPADPVGTRAARAAEAAVQASRGQRTNRTRDVNVNIAARTRDTVYLRVGSMTAPASLPVEFDSRSSRVVLPVGDDFASAGFVVGVTT